MQLLRENYLNVSYSARSGLALKWNFHDFLKTTVYFHHLFVVATHCTNELSELLSMFFERTKLGDPVAFLYVDGKGECRLRGWVEKDGLEDSPIPGLVRNMTEAQVQD